MKTNLLNGNVLYDVDFEGGSGSSAAIDDAPGYDHKPDLSVDDDDVESDYFPVHEYGPTDKDMEADEDGDTQDDGSDDDSEEGADDDDPYSVDGEDTGEEGDSAGEGEGDQSDQRKTDLYLRAGQLGVPKDQVAKFDAYGSDALEAHLDVIESYSQGNGNELQDGGNEGDTGYVAPKAYEPIISNDDYEDALVDDISGMSKHYHGEFERTHKIIENVAGAFLNQQSNHINAVVNEQIDALAGYSGMDFENTLGAGTDGIVPKGSVAETNRGRIVAEIQKVQQERSNNGQPPMTTKRAFAEAVKKVTGKDISTHNKNVLSKANARSKNVSQRKGRKTIKRASSDANERNRRAVNVWSDLDD